LSWFALRKKKRADDDIGVKYATHASLRPGGILELLELNPLLEPFD
jgi:hypothetical protein